MKRLAILALGLALAPLAGAQLYKYTDKDGKTVYTDQPPPTADSKQIRVQPAAPAPSAPAKSALERDKEVQKARDADKDKSKKAEDEAKNAAAKQANCNVAKQQYQHYLDGGKIYQYNAAGERELMSDDQIDSARARSKRELDEACKP
jgi:hypothetical protein